MGGRSRSIEDPRRSWARYSGRWLVPSFGTGWNRAWGMVNLLSRWTCNHARISNEKPALLHLRAINWNLLVNLGKKKAGETGKTAWRMWTMTEKLVSHSEEQKSPSWLGFVHVIEAIFRMILFASIEQLRRWKKFFSFANNSFLLVYCKTLEKHVIRKFTKV